MSIRLHFQIIAAIFLTMLGPQAQAGCASTGELQCPKNATEFRIFRDQVAHTFEIQSPENIGSDHFLDEISEQFAACMENKVFAKLMDEEPLKSCAKNLRSITDLRTTREPPQNFKPNPQLELPPEISQDPELMKLLTHANGAKPDPKNPTKGSNLDLAAKYIEKNINSKKSKDQKWLVLPYKPQDLPFDPSLIIVAPGNPEKVIHVEQQGPGESFFAQIAIVTKPDGTREMVPTDHYTSDGTKNSLQGIHGPSSTRFCAECHRMGLKPFVPVKLDPDYQKQYDAFLKKVTDYAPMQFKGVAPMDFPGMGQDDKLADLRRNDTLFKSCASDVPKESWPRIKKAMNCTSCHYTGQGGLGTIGFPEGMRDNFTGYATMTATQAQSRLNAGKSDKFGETVFSHIMTGMMPEQDNELNTTAERAALLRCLTTEYFKGNGETPGILPAWIKEGDCGVSSEKMVIEALAQANKNAQTPGTGGINPALNKTPPAQPTEPHPVAVQIAN